MTPPSDEGAARAPRLFFLDWLRIIAFAVLVLYHTGMYYVTWPFHLKSPLASRALEPWMKLTEPWRMSLPKEFKNIANKAFDGLLNDLVKVSPEGYVTLTNVCAVAGLGGKPFRDGSFEYYVNEKKKDNDPKATGPFILAALQLDR